MDTKRLQVFEDLAQDLHFGRTAERHNMSPSTLSRLIRRLEDDVGASLLQRDNRNVSLTESGESFRDFVQKTLHEWQHFQSLIQVQQQNVRGTVSLYCSVTASHSLLTDILANLRQRSAIEIKLHTGDQALSLQRVRDAQEDFAIAARPDKIDKRIAFKPLSSSQLVFIAPRCRSAVKTQLMSMRERNQWDWSTLPWIVAEKGIVRKRLNDWFRKQNIKPSIYAQVTGHEAIVSMVSLGFGIGLVPKLVITNSPAFDSIDVIEGDLVQANNNRNKMGALSMPFDIGLCVLKRRLNEPLIQAVWSSAI